MPYNPSVQDRSGEILAQGISKGFSSLTQGVEKYYKKKEENEFLNTAIQGKLGMALKQMQDFQANKAAYGGIPPLNPEMLEKFQNIGGAGTAKLKALNADFDVMLQRSASALNESYTIAKTREMNAEANQRTVNAEQEKTAGILLRTIGGMTDPNARQKAILELPSAIQVRVVGALSALQKMNNETGTEISPEVFKQLRDQGLNVTGNPMANGNIYATKVGTYAPPAVTNINTGDNRMMADAQASLRKTKTDEINPMIAGKANVEAMDALINAGVNDKGQVITGAFANLEIGAKSILNATGLTNFEDVAASQQYLANSATLVGQIIKQFGAGTGLSDSDREFATSAAAGNLKFDKQALVKLVGLAKRVYKKRGELYNKDVEQTFGKPTAKEGFDPARSLYVDPSEFDFSTKGKPSPSGSSNSPIRRDSQGREYVRGPNGEAIPVNR